MSEPIHIGAVFSLKPHLKTVVQGTSECTAARVYHIAVCPEGFREDLPQFGVPELAFQRVPLGLAAFEAAIRQWEPEATLTSSEDEEAMSTGLRRVGLEVS